MHAADGLGSTVTEDLNLGIDADTFSNGIIPTYLANYHGLGIVETEELSYLEHEDFLVDADNLLNFGTGLPTLEHHINGQAEETRIIEELENYDILTGTEGSLSSTGTNQTREFIGTLDNGDSYNPTRSGSLSDDYVLPGVDAPGQVEINLTGDFDTYLQLINAHSGELISFDDDGGSGLNSRLTFTPQENLNYLVRVTSFSAHMTGNYTLTIEEKGIAGTTITSNQSLSGNLALRDLSNPAGDDYVLTGFVPGEQVRINLDANFPTSVQLVNADTGNVLGSNSDNQLLFTAQEEINYLLRVTSADTSASGDYTITATTNNTDFNNSYGYGLVNAAQAVSLARGQGSTANIPDLGGNQWGNDLVAAPEVWATGITGAGITVAVIDTGVDINHPDLQNSIWVNPGEIAGDGIDNDGNGYVDDIHGWNFSGNNSNILPNQNFNEHGTHVAGIIAAGNNDLGTTGVAHNARIMALKLGDADSEGNFINPGNLATAIRYAVDNGADAINLSVSWSNSLGLQEALAYATANNVIIVSAAGNESLSTPQQAPAIYADNYGVTVGAVSRNGSLANFSNRAGSDTNLQYVVAPGSTVYSTLPNNQYGVMSGTSMAAPHVSGVVALMLSANRELTHAEVRHILTNSTTVVG